MIRLMWMQNVEIAEACQEGSPFLRSILDVGSGPVSVLGKTWPECPSAIVSVTMLDSRAEMYSRVRESLGLPPEQLVAGVAEKIPFEDDYFTLAFARNSLDHTDNPVQAIREMIRVSRQVHLIHFR